MKSKKLLNPKKGKNSNGCDEISTKILKVSVPYIISPLTYICNKSLSQGVFPDALKFSIVKLIFKNGDKLITSNYRPISLLASFSKVFEKLIYNRLLEHMNIKNIQDTEQYSFRKNT
jgi:Notch-like protein